MISNRFFRLFSTITKTGNYFGAFAFAFNQVLAKASHNSSLQLKFKIRLNQILCIFVVLTCLALTTHEYIYGSINKLLLKALFTFALCYVLLIHFISQNYTDDLVIFTNAVFGFLRYVHGKK